MKSKSYQSRRTTPTKWLIISLNVLLIIGSLWFYLGGYRFDCHSDLNHDLGFCTLRSPNGDGQSLQMGGRSLAYWRWEAASLTNTRVWLFQWQPYFYETVILPDDFFEARQP